MRTSKTAISERVCHIPHVRAVMPNGFIVWWHDGETAPCAVFAANTQWVDTDTLRFRARELWLLLANHSQVVARGNAEEIAAARGAIALEAAWVHDRAIENGYDSTTLAVLLRAQDAPRDALTACQYIEHTPLPLPRKGRLEPCSDER